jgi:xyloglucan-specific exo-beta-1,4-glucanase
MRTSLLAAIAAATAVHAAVTSDLYTWNNVKIGGGGGFVPNIIFNTGERNLAFAR